MLRFFFPDRTSNKSKGLKGHFTDAVRKSREPVWLESTTDRTAGDEITEGTVTLEYHCQFFAF